MGLSPQYGTRQGERDLNEIYKRLENPGFEIVLSTPDLTNIAEGQALWVNSNGVVSLFTRVNNILYSNTFTRWN